MNKFMEKKCFLSNDIKVKNSQSYYETVWGVPLDKLWLEINKDCCYDKIGRGNCSFFFIP